MTQAPETSVALACGWDDITGLLPPTPCQEPAIGTVTEACVHEHLFEARACAHHAAGVQLDGPAVCGECATGPRPHDCPVVTLITWDDPTAPPTVVREPDSDFTEEDEEED
jgi:hypothetical protein